MIRYLRVLIPSICVVALAMVMTIHGFQGVNGIGGVRGQADAAYAIGLWGDLPYSDVQENVGVPNLIADMNSQKLVFSVHDGDLKQGSNSPCNDALYAHSIYFLNQLESPASRPDSCGVLVGCRA